MKKSKNIQNIETLINAAKKLVDYFDYHNSNTTKAQDEKIELLREALLKIKAEIK